MPCTISAIYINQSIQIEQFKIVGEECIEFGVLRRLLVAQPSLLPFFVVDLEILPDLDDQFISLLDETVFELHELIYLLAGNNCFVLFVKG
jgi:hypothetical protein